MGFSQLWPTTILGSWKYFGMGPSRQNKSALSNCNLIKIPERAAVHKTAQPTHAQGTCVHSGHSINLNRRTCQVGSSRNMDVASFTTWHFLPSGTDGHWPYLPVLMIMERQKQAKRKQIYAKVKIKQTICTRVYQLFIYRISVHASFCEELLANNYLFPCLACHTRTFHTKFINIG